MFCLYVLKLHYSVLCNHLRLVHRQNQRLSAKLSCCRLHFVRIHFIHFPTGVWVQCHSVFFKAESKPYLINTNKMKNVSARLHLIFIFHTAVKMEENQTSCRWSNLLPESAWLCGTNMPSTKEDEGFTSLTEVAHAGMLTMDYTYKTGPIIKTL